MRQVSKAPKMIESSPSPVDAQLKKLWDKVPVIPVGCDDAESVPFYNLPPVLGHKNHDITRIKAPVVVMRGRQRSLTDSDGSGPGPADFDTRGCTRFGKHRTARAVLVGRQHVPSSEFDNPGPGTYAPENHKLPGDIKTSVKGRGYRPQTDQHFPGPGDYSAEKVLGVKLPRMANAPVPVINGRPRNLDFYSEAGPGPGKYHINSQATSWKAPAPRIGGRFPTMNDITEGPAPNAYYPKSSQFGKRAPAFSFGRKQSRCVAVIVDENDNNNFDDYYD